jgi:hypothetical protein
MQTMANQENTLSSENGTSSISLKILSTLTPDESLMSKSSSSSSLLVRLPMDLRSSVLNWLKLDSILIMCKVSLQHRIITMKHLSHCQSITFPYIHDNDDVIGYSEQSIIDQLLILLTVPKQLREIHTDKRPRNHDVLFQLQTQINTNVMSIHLENLFVDAINSLIRVNKSTLRVVSLVNLVEEEHIKSILYSIIFCPMFSRYQFGLIPHIPHVSPMLLMQTRCQHLTGFEFNYYTGHHNFKYEPPLPSAGKSIKLSTISLFSKKKSY